MYRQDIDLQGDKVSLITQFDRYAIPKLAQEERKESGRGFSKGGNMRKLGTITMIELQFWAQSGDDDAAVMLSQDVSQTEKTRAVRSFFRKHPEYRTSEGAV